MLTTVVSLSLFLWYRLIICCLSSCIMVQTHNHILKAQALHILLYSQMSCTHSSLIPFYRTCLFSTLPAATICSLLKCHVPIPHSSHYITNAPSTLNQLQILFASQMLCTDPSFIPLNHKCPFNTLPNNTGATYAAACFSRVTRSSLIHSITSQMLLQH